ncbi:hypothetical protein ACTD5D_23040 [Nocardia takedensis]|uniref:hypothetical protein n=1 Tax=Nocardia takedensis TaxID=259390 RepID=UPI003F763218
MLSGCSRTFARPLLMVTLVVAVLGMHHLLFSVVDAPVHSPGSHHASSGETAVMSASIAVEAETHAACCALPPVAGEGESDGRGGAPAGEHHGGHDLLHLCLAIMAAIAGVALVLIALIWPLSVRVQRGGLRRGVSGLARPPPGPTLRRLAVLCVLRQ